MEKHKVFGLTITYHSAIGKPEVTFFVSYISSIFYCSVCNEMFVEYEDDVLYGDLTDEIRNKICPTCHTPLPDCLQEQKIPLLIKDRSELDQKMLKEGYGDVSLQNDVYRQYYDLFS